MSATGWAAVFATANMVALVAWVALVALPRWPALRSAIMYLGVGLLCLVYAVLLGGLVSGTISPGGQGTAASFTTIAGVMGLFSTPGGATVGWTHYLAFDLFTGLWIAHDADAKRIGRLIQLPVLVLTFLVGPVGLLAWLVIREPAARRAMRATRAEARHAA